MKREREKNLSIMYNSVSIGYFLLLFVSNEYIQFVHPVSFYAFILTVHISTLVPNKLYWDYWPSTHSRVFCGLKSRVHTSIIFGDYPLVKAYSNFRYTANIPILVVTSTPEGCVSFLIILTPVSQRVALEFANLSGKGCALCRILSSIVLIFHSVEKWQ